jgi:chromosomal replication initiation ATPase DnaA
MNESFYNDVVKEVCDYFGVRRYDVLMVRTNDRSKQNAARVIAVYLIRFFTGDTFKKIGIFFDNTASHTGGQYVRAYAKRNSGSEKYAKYKKDIIELEKRIYQKKFGSS